jgi:hypothetical protein
MLDVVITITDTDTGSITHTRIPAMLPTPAERIPHRALRQLAHAVRAWATTSAPMFRLSDRDAVLLTEWQRFVTHKAPARVAGDPVEIDE